MEENLEDSRIGQDEGGIWSVSTNFLYIFLKFNTEQLFLQS